tara:strand:- start:1998 stop:2600 length:603 start_codon:yes stop_codon:yes gene_type:complete
MAKTTKKNEEKDELNEEEVSNLETEQVQEEDNEPIQKVKAKKPKTQKQIDAFNALQERNKIRWAEKRKAKEEGVNMKVVEKSQPIDIPKRSASLPAKKQVVESEEEEIEYVKAPKKKRKARKIVIEQDEDSSDDEIVISRSRRSNRDKSIKRKEQEEGYKQDMLNQEMEKEKPLKIVDEEEKVEEKKPISHRELLRAFGL